MRKTFGNLVRVVITLAISLYVSLPVSAHTSLAEYVRHQVFLQIGLNHIDIEITLTFYAARSMAERQRMDTDHNGKITKEEIQTYLELLQDGIEQNLCLKIDDRESLLTPLYDPEIDLQGANLVGPFSHTLRLFYFARTPTRLLPNSLIALDDRLWRQLPAIYSLDARGEKGIRVLANPPVSAVNSTGMTDISRTLFARCLSISGKNTPPQGGKNKTSSSKKRKKEKEMSARPD